jgi:ATP-dependent Clp protease ATP-binding subunit ClpA
VVLGHGEEGQLTGAVRRSPFAVVLLDEIEKAHPEVLNVLLELLDEGRLTDGRGRRADFRQTIVILTSNLGAEARATDGLTVMGFASPRADAPTIAGRYGEEELAAERARVLEAAAAGLRPELWNRIGHKVAFDPLSLAALEEVVEQAIGALEKNLADRRVKIDLSPEARRLLAARANDPRYGAREVERVVERDVARPIGEVLLSGALAPGARVRVGVAADGRIAVAVR